MTIKERNEVTQENYWNVQAMYPSFQDWEKDFSQFFPPEKLKADIKWPDLHQYKGQLKNGDEILKQVLELIFQINRKIEFLYTYAHLRHDEDIVNDAHKAAIQRITTVAFEFQKELAWFEPEILSLPQDILDRYLNSSLLAPYQFYLKKIVRLKPHTLSVEQEELLALAGKSLETAPRAFSAYNNADIKFGTIKNDKGEDKELSHGLYNLYIRDQDRTLRKNAFKGLSSKFFDLENTLSELISGLVESHIFSARARKYDNCLHAALFPKDVPLSVYYSLIKAVREGLKSLHRYVDLRKRILKLDEIHLYDMYVPLVPAVDIKMSYEEAEELTIQSSSALGSEYQQILTKGLRQDKWVDRFENRNKRSGAYSSGCYDSYPYILMNFRGILKDTFTLAHEAGHSMHSFLSNHNQPYHYASYPIFVAEVASTFNEELLMHLLINRAQTKEEKAFLINEKIEDIRGTLFRQTMFAEYELKIHQMAESGIPLTPTLLKDEYRKLNEDYFGKEAFIDQEIQIEWARIPHFYYNFYVYQYATGISAALSLAEKILNGTEQQKKETQTAYLNFLKSGGSKFPIDLLKTAGVDVTSNEPVNAAIRTFDSLITQLENLLKT